MLGSLSRNQLGPEGAKALAPGIAAHGRLMCCNVLNNDLDLEAANLLVEAVKSKDVSLCGIEPEQTSADFCGRGLGAPDAVLLSSDLSKAAVTGGLTKME